MQYTHENITYLEPNQVFIFGSNLAGRHIGGAAKMANDEQRRIMELDEPKKWWHKYLGKDTFFEHVFGGLIPDLILEAQQLERERIVGVVDRLDQEMRCHPDEIHCTCWIHAYDVLKKELY